MSSVAKIKLSLQRSYVFLFNPAGSVAFDVRVDVGVNWTELATVRLPLPPIHATTFHHS